MDLRSVGLVGWAFWRGWAGWGWLGLDLGGKNKSLGGLLWLAVLIGSPLWLVGLVGVADLLGPPLGPSLSVLTLTQTTAEQIRSREVQF